MSVYDGETAVYETTLVDIQDQPVPESAITSMFLTLYDKQSRTPVNNKNNIDVRNGGAWDKGVVVDPTSGAIKVYLESADNVILGAASSKDEETRRLVLKGTSNTTPVSTFVIIFEYEIEPII